MRLEVHVEIGGSALSDGAVGIDELERILFVDLREQYETAHLFEAGDEVVLRDYNGELVGYARMVPDWTVGEEVWVTIPEGTLLRSTIHSVNPAATSLGYWAVTCRYIASHELLTPVLVDAWGRDHSGRPVLGRVR